MNNSKHFWLVFVLFKCWNIPEYVHFYRTIQTSFNILIKLLEIHFLLFSQSHAKAKSSPLTQERVWVRTRVLTEFYLIIYAFLCNKQIQFEVYPTSQVVTITTVQSSWQVFVSLHMQKVQWHYNNNSQDSNHSANFKIWPRKSNYVCKIILKLFSCRSF